MSIPNGDHLSDIRTIHGLMWHFECMALSGEAIENFRPPADSFQMRMHYSLYLINLMSAIDMVRDWCGNPFKEALHESLKTSMFSGSDILDYLRELRNGVVHRGVDPTSGGTVINAVTWAVAPNTVKDRTGIKSYSAPTILLRDLFIHCEICTKPVIERYIQPYLEGLNSLSFETVSIHAFDAMEAFPHIPGWAKEMARQHITPDILEKAQMHHTAKFRELLKPSQRQRLYEM